MFQAQLNFYHQLNLLRKYSCFSLIHYYFYLFTILRHFWDFFFINYWKMWFVLQWQLLSSIYTLPHGLFFLPNHSSCFPTCNNCKWNKILTFPSAFAFFPVFSQAGNDGSTDLQGRPPICWVIKSSQIEVAQNTTDGAWFLAGGLFLSFENF